MASLVTPRKFAVSHRLMQSLSPLATFASVTGAYMTIYICHLPITLCKFFVTSHELPLLRGIGLCVNTARVALTITGCQCDCVISVVVRISHGVLCISLLSLPYLYKVYRFIFTLIKPSGRILDLG